jgi:3-dehydroquinate dehydratase-2
MRDFSKEKMNFYRGELHDHTTKDHDHDNFLATDFSPSVFLEYIDEQNLREFAVESDHASVITDEYFFRCFTEYEKMRDRMRPIVFPSCESEIMYVEEDRYGVPYRYSGELLTINADNYAYTETFEEFIERLRAAFSECEVDYFQSNIEGELIDQLHKSIGRYDGVVLNAGGYTHTAVALADAVGAVSTPVVEVHISSILAREEFRHVSLIAPRAVGSIMGFGLDSYRLGMLALGAKQTSKM